MPAEPAALAVPEIAAPTVASRGWRLPMFPVGVIGLFLLLALVAPLLSLADPYEQSLRNRFTPPVWEERGSWKHPLGTDRLGRDMLSRIIWGARVSLAAGVVTVLLASAFGAAVGLIAGYYGGRVD
ncbi:MAG TPA: hypothetical protein VK547_16530, partial [Candidatus Udaeobacter sp.]|nr:hypothetical protein [Candidatus Udaeobacter sp.]